jgi:hypothetical protein
MIYQDKIIARAFDADRPNNRYRVILTIEDCFNWSFYTTFISNIKELKV